METLIAKFVITFFLGGGFINPVSHMLSVPVEQHIPHHVDNDDPRPIRGTVKKPNADPISGATVRLYNSSGTTLLATVSTDGSGAYAFSPVLPGIYQVKASATGYQDSTQIAVVTDADVILNFVLQEQ
jgi:hypothetical protein